MEITNDAPEWAAEDVSVLRAFLKSPTGQRFWTNLTSATPVLLPGGADLNAILIRSGEVRGVQLAVKAVVDLAYPPKDIPETTTDYPPLTDDKAWQDGQTLVN